MLAEVAEAIRKSDQRPKKVARTKIVYVGALRVRDGERPLETSIGDLRSSS
jgi:hypothetical protein